MWKHLPTPLLILLKKNVWYCWYIDNCLIFYQLIMGITKYIIPSRVFSTFMVLYLNNFPWWYSNITPAQSLLWEQASSGTGIFRSSRCMSLSRSKPHKINLQRINAKCHGYLARLAMAKDALKQAVYMYKHSHQHGHVRKFCDTTSDNLETLVEWLPLLWSAVYIILFIAYKSCNHVQNNLVHFRQRYRVN